MSTARNIVVTYALPYANGSIHIGHMLGMIQTDVWVRFQRMRGHTVHFFNGDDAHGTPIMLSAEKAGISPEELISRYHQEHSKDLNDFGIEFNNFYSTHSPENEKLASAIYLELEKNGHIAKRTIKQAFDPEKNMFLPDRYVKGECPKCGADDQYGDNCEACGATYSPTDLKNPISALSGVAPIEKESEHYFFKLGDFEAMLKDWTQSGHLQPEVANKLKEWFESGLQDWDISRDAPYFGIPIPNTKDKFFYVWLDAPIGYFSSMLNYAAKNKDFDFEAVVKKDSAIELLHFVGKDIIYFHALFWPAVLTGSNHRTPDAVYAHGFVTVNGQKMSKSRGTFINARTYLDHLNPEYLRYYFCARLNHSLDDIDFTEDDFTQRVNSDLVGKYVNIASRSANFIVKNFDGKLSGELDKPELIAKISGEAENIAQLYENREYSKAVREIMALADLANQYIAEAEPWKKIKADETRDAVQGICTTALNAFRILTIYLKPILPKIASEAEKFLNLPPQQWQDAQNTLLNHAINPYKPLLQRIDPKEVAKMTDAEQQAATEAAAPQLSNPLADEINIDDFLKVDLRVAKIIEANPVEGADKLIQLKLDLGDGVTKQVFAGIKSAYNPEDLAGKLTIMVANLKPRKMRFGMSEGMVLAASGEGPGIYILEPHDGAQPGMRVK